MYRATDPQLPLLASSNVLSESAKSRLEKSWAHGFALEIMPILLEQEERFAALYSSTGRPNWSVARILGVCLLQEFFGYDDQRALDCMSFDIRWQYALGLGADDTYLSRRSLINFRTRLVEHDPEMTLLKGVFEQVGEAMIERFDISVSDQRVDSTHITSNIRRRGQTALFGKVIHVFARQLKRHSDQWWQALPEPVRQWYDKDVEDIDSWFGPGQDKGPSTQEYARWLVMLRDQFAENETVKDWESYEHLLILIRDHIEESGDDEPDPPEGGGERGDKDELSESKAHPAIKVRKKAKNRGSTLHSPFDPDAGLGKKGLGYEVHVVETCNNPDRPEVITAVKVVPANTSDLEMATPLLDELGTMGRQPTKILADAGYVGPPAMERAVNEDVDLYGPMRRGKLPADTVGREAFEYDNDGNIVRCPQGHEPLRTSLRKYRDEIDVPHTYFDRQLCDACPIQGQCISRGYGTNNREVINLNRLRLRDERLALQKNDDWWEGYSMRAGVEATVSELKRGHGLARLRVRRKPKVTLAVTLKVTACNIKRWLKAG
jgi:hypothetical protein